MTFSIYNRELSYMEHKSTGTQPHKRAIFLHKCVIDYLVYSVHMVCSQKMPSETRFHSPRN